MATAKPKDTKKTDATHCESFLKNLHEELRTSNIAHAMRLEIESKLKGCDEQFKSVLAGKIQHNEFEKKLNTIDRQLAVECINQAEHEIAKKDHTGSAYLALGNLREELESGKIKPSKVRHEVKEIMRHHQP